MLSAGQLRALVCGVPLPSPTCAPDHHSIARIARFALHPPFLAPSSSVTWPPPLLVRAACGAADKQASPGVDEQRTEAAVLLPSRPPQRRKSRAQPAVDDLLQPMRRCYPSAPPPSPCALPKRLPLRPSPSGPSEQERAHCHRSAGRRHRGREKRRGRGRG